MWKNKKPFFYFENSSPKKIDQNLMKFNLFQRFVKINCTDYKSSLHLIKKKHLIEMYISCILMFSVKWYVLLINEHKIALMDFSFCSTIKALRTRQDYKNELKICRK